MCQVNNSVSFSNLLPEPKNMLNEEAIMRKLFYSKPIYITIMFFFIFAVVLAQSGLKMKDTLYQQGKILGRNFKVIYQYFSEEKNGKMVFNRGHLY
ncbi:hypothetical protein ES705_38943 [subsurface metagenome]